jgi:hypothetical protein
MTVHDEYDILSFWLLGLLALAVLVGVATQIESAAGQTRVLTHSGAMQQGACIAKIPQGPDISRGFVVN